MMHEYLRAADGWATPAGADWYLARQEAIIDELAPQVAAAWRAFEGPENRRRLALAIAQL